MNSINLRPTYPLMVPHARDISLGKAFRKTGFIRLAVEIHFLCEYLQAIRQRL